MIYEFSPPSFFQKGSLSRFFGRCLSNLRFRIEILMIIDEDGVVLLTFNKIFTNRSIYDLYLKIKYQYNYPPTIMAEDFLPESRNDAPAVRVADLTFRNFV